MGKAKYHLNRVFTVLKILQAPVISPDSGKYRVRSVVFKLGSVEPL